MAYIVFVKYIIIPEGPSLLDTAVGGGGLLLLLLEVRTLELYS